jgi:hypothetical protein
MQNGRRRLNTCPIFLFCWSSRFCGYQSLSCKKADPVNQIEIIFHSRFSIGKNDDFNRSIFGFQASNAKGWRSLCAASIAGQDLIIPIGKGGRASRETRFFICLSAANPFSRFLINSM